MFPGGVFASRSQVESMVSRYYGGRLADFLSAIKALGYSIPRSVDHVPAICLAGLLRSRDG
jgi:hypothetical protein